MNELEDFHEELYNEVTNGAVVNNDFYQHQLFDYFCQYLNDFGEIDIPFYSYYKDQNGRALNGYYFNDGENGNNSLNLFICSYSGSNKLLNINKDEIETCFKRLENFYLKSLDKNFHWQMEESSDGYEIARLIYEHQKDISNINLYLLTDKRLSTRMETIPSKSTVNVNFHYHLWDLTRLYRVLSSERVSEDIVINFREEFECELQCLPANFESSEYRSFLVVVPGLVLSKLYEKYGSRLLERNVRSFLQVRGKVNKKIRETILKEPERFFAYNNGITATAEDIKLEKGKIAELKNLQIVNGGQTTASLFNAYKKDKADIKGIFVQMKLSVISQEMADEMVPLISKYANSQNKVNDADFFATHAFHKRIEEFSRRIYVPAGAGQLTQSKWFYERARGQYLNGYAYSSSASAKKFKLEFPKKQVFTKTDLAKFEGVWMQLPHIVSKGAQYIFLDFANKIEGEWKKDDKPFNELYYKTCIAKAIIFKETESIVTNSSWYDGGYRANIVAYSLSFVAYKIQQLGKSLDFLEVWNTQTITETFKNVLKIVTKKVHDKLLNNGVFSNVGQYCKRSSCWDAVKAINFEFSASFVDELIEIDDFAKEVSNAKKVQKIDNGIEAQKKVMEHSPEYWQNVLEYGRQKRVITPKEESIIGYLLKNKFVSEKQSIIMLEILDKISEEGFSG